MKANGTLGNHMENTDSKGNMTAWHQSLLELAKQNDI